MKKLIITLMFFGILASSSFAGEQINLTTPITKPAISSYRVVRLELDWDAARIEIHLKFTPSGERIIFGYSGTEALNLMKTINTKNFSTTSMQKTILQKLIADGKILGTISGSPD